MEGSGLNDAFALPQGMKASFTDAPSFASKPTSGSNPLICCYKSSRPTGTQLP